MKKDKEVSFFNQFIYRGDKRLFLSTLALVLGIVTLAAGAIQGQESLKVGGIYMILGALAYRSAKKVKLEIIKPSTTRFVFELVEMAIIAVLIWFTEKDLAVNDPVPYLVIPIWAIIAYVVIRFRNRNLSKNAVVLLLLFLPFIVSASFESNLYYGLQNNNSVKEMQEFLTDQGVYSGPVTGNFYSLTLKAVKDFQKKEKISPTSGFFGPLTRQRANEILSVNIEPSNQQSIKETGSTPPPVEPAKTTNDIVKSLQDQIALLMQQIQAMQAQQTSVQQLQQTVQQQAQTINQIQQNTQQIAQNTTSVCTPSWSCETWNSCSNSQKSRICTDSNNCSTNSNKPDETQSCTMPYIELFDIYQGSGMNKTHKVSPIYPEMQNESNYVQIAAVVFDENGNDLRDKAMTITATDLENPITRNGTGSVSKIYKNGGEKSVYNYQLYYEFKTSGQNTITFSFP